ncbi:PRC-barrel domain-containing protein [Rhodococcus sp. NM-2]|uniref:PRC-barrel domain-containing protein n=1 Tax=Rhodococcus sp. NM-2 TaxID=3401174 RepID=UPI003AAFB1A5
MATENEKQPTLIDLDDTDLAFTDQLEDLRGRKVYDRDGDEIGQVDGLIVDERENTVRFLRIGSGGFLGLGKTARLIPVEAITGRDADKVHIDRTKETVAGSSPYDPELVETPEYYGGLYGYYGYLPFWGARYISPYRALPREDDDHHRP